MNHLHKVQFIILNARTRVGSFNDLIKHQLVTRHSLHGHDEERLEVQTVATVLLLGACDEFFKPFILQLSHVQRFVERGEGSWWWVRGGRRCQI